MLRMFQSRNQEIRMAETQPQDGLQASRRRPSQGRRPVRRLREGDRAGAKEKLARQICTELKIHSQIEEEIYYPAIRGKVEEDALDEAYVEHDSAKLLVNELEAASPTKIFTTPRSRSSRGDRASCPRGREAARQPLQQTRADVDLDALGEQLAARKAELMALAETQGLPPAEPRP